MKIKVNKVIWNVEKIVGKYAVLKHKEFGTMVYKVSGLDFIKEIGNI